MIGLGAVGERLLRAFEANADTEVVAVCDTNEERVRTVAEQLGGVFGARDYREVLAQPQVEVVYVAVPPKFHRDIVINAFAAGKHVLCEKPLANSVEEAAAMRDAAVASGLVHAMHFPMMYRPEFAEMKRLVEEGYLGDLRRIELKAHFQQWPRPWQVNPWIATREQGGFVREVFPHYIHMIQEMFGRVAETEAVLEFTKEPGHSETGMMGRMMMESGTPVLLDGLADTAKPEEIVFGAYGTEGSLVLTNWSVLWKGGPGQAVEKVEVLQADRHIGLVTELVRAIGGQPATIVDFEKGYEVQVVLEQLLQGRSS